MKNLDDQEHEMWPLCQYSNNIEPSKDSLRTDNDLQPWINPRRQKLTIPILKKTGSKAQSSNKSGQLQQKLTVQFLSNLRHLKKMPKPQSILRQVKPISPIQQGQNQQAISNGTEPQIIDFQQLGTKNQAQYENCLRIPFNSKFSSTFYRCFDQKQLTLQIFPTQGPPRKDSSLMKNSNLQRILRMKQRIRRKNHTHVQKVKLQTAEGYQSMFHSKQKSGQREFHSKQRSVQRNLHKTLQMKSTRDPITIQKVTSRQSGKNKQYSTFYRSHGRQSKRLTPVFNRGYSTAAHNDLMHRTLYF